MSSNNGCSVSVVVACANEEIYIANCLDSIIANDFPKDKLEVLVVDGMSQDGTREIIDAYSRKYGFIKRLDNPRGITPAAFNIGIKHAKGDAVMIMGSHSVYEADYIKKCVKYLYEFNAHNVGGVIKTLPGEKTPEAKSIALALSHPFGVGNSSFRVGSTEPRWADTVFGGCYKREVFSWIGLFNENLVRSQDMDFNIRLRAAGGRILLVPSIVSRYFAKSTIKAFFKHNFKDGIWAVYPLKFGSSMFKLRHLLPLFFVLSILGSFVLSPFWKPFLLLGISILALYTLTNLYFSSKIASREKRFRYLASLPVVFASRHFGYGLGSVWGALKLLF